MTEPRTIEHDANEPSRRALKIISVLTAVIVLAVSVPLVFGVNWTMRQLPAELLLLICGIGLGGSAGFFLGRRDAIRQFRTPGRDE
ncbi:hypothetical protein AJ87_03015 [Rhizobium yanglingense]|nr:hypothetical protein AJ87_03015 [Rhizobium yanglingense]